MLKKKKMNNNLKKTSSINDVIELNTLFIDGIQYINTQQWAFAYKCFKEVIQIRKDKSVALLYNMALCHFYADEYNKAFSLLTQSLMQQNTPQSPTQQLVVIPESLLNLEFESSNYQLGLLDNSAIYTNLIKLRIRRLLIDVHIKLENWHEIIKLSELPDMMKCKNVRIAVEISKSKTNII